jgi:hypothetical protein
MRLQVPFLQLPLLFDAPALAAEVAAFGEDLWRPHPQGYAGNSMLPLVAVDGDPDNESFAGPMRPVPALARCPYLSQVMASIGVVLGRSRLMRLSGHAEVDRHVDQGYYWTERVRVHVPIVTQPTVRFECGDAAVNMAAGECWIFDTWRPHRVINDAEAARIHLVVDTVGGEGFWSFAARGRAHGVPATPGWQPSRILPQSGVPTLAFESSNVPAVMSPWELNSQLSMLFADAIPNEHLAEVQQISANLIRTWRSLWAQYGDAAEGRAHYRAVLARFAADVRPAATQLPLRNEVQWYGAMMTAIGKFAVREEPGAHAGVDEGITDNA